MIGRRRADPLTPAGSTDRREYLLSVLETLWPEPAVVEHTPGRRRQVVANSLDFIVVPNSTRPALVLPRRPRRVAAAGLRNYKTGATARTRLKLQLLGIGAQVGLADLLPDRIRITGLDAEVDASIESYLVRQLGRDVFLGLYVGVDRAVQKPVLQLLAASGETVGFAKIGTNELTRDLVSREARSLALLSTRHLRRVRVPGVLHRGQWRSHEVLVQEPLSGKSGGDTDPSVLVDAMLEVAGVDGLHHAPALESPYWTDLRARTAQLTPSPYSEVLARAIDRITSTAPDTYLEFGAWHGDWAPWNMTAESGQVQAWDWEHFGACAPVGFDALHFEIQEQLVTHGRSAEEAVGLVAGSAARTLAPLRVDDTRADLVMMLYIVEIATRYLREGEHEAGTRMGNLGSWLEGALDRQLGAVSEQR